MSETTETARPAVRSRLPFLDRGTPRLLAASMLALFMAALDQTIVGPVLADILAEFGGGALLAWVPTGFLLVAMVAAPLYGAVADIQGRRFALLLANVLFLGGSIACALAPSLWLLVLARLLQGAGAGGLVSIPFIIVADRVPMSRRPLFSAFISTIYAVAGLAGPLAGGALAEYMSWRWVFWINLPACLLVWYGVQTALAPRAASRGRQIDWTGAFLLLCASVPLLLIFTGGEAGAEAAGPLLPVPVLGALSALFWGLFGWRMLRGKDPLIPVKVLTNRSILMASLGLACCGGANIGLAVYLPLYFQKFHGLSASEAGMTLLAMISGGLVGAYIPPQILRFYPAYKPLMVGSALGAAISGLALTWIMAGQPTLGALLLPMWIMGLCIGLLFPIFPLVVQNAAEPGQMGAAIGVLSFLRSMGGTVGVSIIGMMAVGSGLAVDILPDDPLPIWSLAAAAAGIMMVAFLGLSFLPNRKLEGFGRARR